MKLYVGNLPWSVDDSGLRELFTTFGAVKSAQVLTDRETGRSRGFGFVEMADRAAAQEAISSLNGHEVESRALRVSEAQEKQRSGGRGRSY